MSKLNFRAFPKRIFCAGRRRWIVELFQQTRKARQTLLLPDDVTRRRIRRLVASTFFSRAQTRQLRAERSGSSFIKDTLSTFFARKPLNLFVNYYEFDSENSTRT